MDMCGSANGVETHGTVDTDDRPSSKLLAQLQHSMRTTQTVFNKHWATSLCFTFSVQPWPIAPLGLKRQLDTLVSQGFERMWTDGSTQPSE